MLKEKIAQMLIIGFKGEVLHPSDAIVQAIMRKQIGGVILFDYDFQTKTFAHNIKNPQQLKHLIQQLQDYAKQAQLSPLLMSIDYEGGKVNRLKEAYGFPKTLSAAQLGACDINEVKHYANEMAQTLQNLGVNVNFAPVVDINVNSANPVIGKMERSFSSDVQQVIKLASIFAEAYGEHGIAYAYKHFPGHGSSTGDTHAGFVDVTQTWKEYELDPYRTLSLHPPMVLTAHVVHRGLDSDAYPASLSPAITTQLLRQQLQFDGVIVTDDMQMKAITDNYNLSDAVILAINAGADLLIFGNQLTSTPQDPAELIELIAVAVQNGHISESRVDEAYQRIMKLKKWLQSHQAT